MEREGLDPGFARRLSGRETRPGLVDHAPARAMLARHRGMVAEQPLAQRLLRRAGAAVGTLGQDVPVVFAQPVPAPDPLAEAPAVGRARTGDRPVAARPVDPGAARPHPGPVAGSPAGTGPSGGPAGAARAATTPLTARAPMVRQLVTEPPAIDSSAPGAAPGAARPGPVHASTTGPATESPGVETPVVAPVTPPVDRLPGAPPPVAAPGAAGPVPGSTGGEPVRQRSDAGVAPVVVAAVTKPAGAAGAPGHLSVAPGAGPVARTPASEPQTAVVVPAPRATPRPAPPLPLVDLAPVVAAAAGSMAGAVAAPPAQTPTGPRWGRAAGGPGTGDGADGDPQSTDRPDPARAAPVDVGRIVELVHKRFVRTLAVETERRRGR
jgi:hypothetical protein